MGFLAKILVKAALNLGTLYYLPQFLPGFSGSSDPSLIIGGAVVITLVHLILRPILKLVAFPLVLITFGLFTIVINMAVLAIADALSASISISGFSSLFIASLIFGIINSW